MNKEKLKLFEQLNKECKILNELLENYSKNEKEINCCVDRLFSIKWKNFQIYVDSCNDLVNHTYIMNSANEITRFLKINKDDELIQIYIERIKEKYQEIAQD